MNEHMSEVTVQRFRGTVILAGEQTATVSVVTYKTHPKYRKKYRTSKKYRVHTGGTEVAVGDKVVFIAGKPKSKSKRFKIV